MELDDYNNSTLDAGKAPEKRPVFLTVLCILTLVYAGLSFFGPFIQLLSGPLSAKEMKMQGRMLERAIDQMQDQHLDSVAHIYAQLHDAAIQINQNHYIYNLVLLLTVGAGIVGAILMLKGKKLGFHLYLIYSLLSVMGIYIFVSVDCYPMAFTIVSLIISGIFVFMYSRNLKWLK